MKVDSIVIVGGGTAGYLTALCIDKLLPHIKLTLIESPNIPIIGVGEATTPKIMYVLHDILGVDIAEFHAKVAPTWKLGIKFLWGPPEKEFFNLPFGHMEPIHAHFLTGDINNSSIVSNLMSNDLSPVIVDETGNAKMISNRSFAYHIDNKNFVSFLKGLLKDSNVEYIQGEIESTQKNEQGIKELITTSGQSLTADLFIDCSGFHSILLGKSLATEYISYKSSLFTDSAVTATLANNGFVKPYTSAITMNSGWMWNIPLNDHDHLGYVYSSKYCGREGAIEEILKMHPSAEINPHTVTFKSGRYKSFIYQNVVGIGNAYGFVEPLESTGLHMICFEILELMKVLKEGTITKKHKEQLDQLIGNQWDMLRWFLAIHYKFNTKIDSPFWHDCRSKVNISGVEQYLDHFMNFGPISFAKKNKIHHELSFDPIFSPVGFDAILLGQNVIPQWEEGMLSDSEVNYFNLGHTANKAFMQQAIPMNEALEIAVKKTDLISLKGWFDHHNH